MNVQEFKELFVWFDRFCSNPSNTLNQIHPYTVIRIKSNLTKLAEKILSEYPYFSEELLNLKDFLFNKMGMANPFILGRIYEIMQAIKQPVLNKRSVVWEEIHPQIKNVSKKLYEDGHYAEAAENAFKEINSRVKKIFKYKCPNVKVLDGVALMTTVFSDNEPLIEFDDHTSESGKNIQKGFMMMLAGAMAGLRNPKAHENLTIENTDAMRQLMFASMLMYKIDEGVEYSHINEYS